MAFTTNPLSAIDAAIASGQVKVKYDGKEVEYRSMAELKQARSFIVAQLTEAGLMAPSRLSNRGPASLATFSRD
jgi:roadblock/LC7 domain-containing protein